MTPRTRAALETYADGMGIPFPVVRALYLRKDRTGRGRTKVAMQQLESRWREREARRARRPWNRALAWLRALLRRGRA